MHCIPIHLDLRVQRPPGGIPGVDSKGFGSFRGVPIESSRCKGHSARLKCDRVVSDCPGKNLLQIVRQDGMGCCSIFHEFYFTETEEAVQRLF